MKMHIDFVKSQIANLLASFPEMEDDEILRRDSLEGETDATKLLSRLIRVRNETQAQVQGLSEYAKELAERKSRLERRADACRSMAFQILDAANISSFVLPEATLTVQAGQRSVVITDEAKLPDKFIRTKREPDKTALKEALKSGETIDGAELSNATPYLTIRTK